MELENVPVPLLLASEEEPPPLVPAPPLCSAPAFPTRRIASPPFTEPGGYQVCFKGEGTTEAGMGGGGGVGEGGDMSQRRCVLDGKVVKGAWKREQQREKLEQTNPSNPTSARCCPLTPHL